jgi:hypothetical protein
MDLRGIGERGLTGWTGRVAGWAAGPISRRTRFGERDVRAALGWALLVVAGVQLLRGSALRRLLRR